MALGPPVASDSGRGTQLWVVATVMVVVSGFFVSLRLIGRYFRSMLWVDDWAIVAAHLFSIAFSVCNIMSVKHGFGNHTWEVPKPERIQALKWSLIVQVIYKIVISLTKVAILLLYLRLFSVQKVFRWLCYALIALTVLSGIAYTPLTIWQCSPVQAFWDRSIPHQCIGNQHWRLSYSVINIGTDFLILFLPIQRIFCLQLERRDKIALIFIFSLGAFVCIISVIRVTTIRRVGKRKDPLWNTFPLGLWSVVEVNTGIVCACMPMIRQSLSVLFPKLFSRNKTRPSGRSLSKSASHRSYGLTNGGSTMPTAAICWTKHEEENIYMASIKPGRESPIFRTESEERIIGPENADPNDMRIFQRTEISIIDSSRA
ncbi:hypothetical protein D8B26_004819 [Coccidioides posadasii str. Silveira]|uniref:Rhodopsin domain-containing protein n=2 Tax=Coccidioides posadasii TaxID=199306 RepID=E9D6H2_COCPS|nr:conserved hypothetical protein [Coccidioides posadasii str. Silveira]KMM68535.1 integral membrane protein [Coccidioides posadasii RMSCC 3488]QVM10157.1 hypothetical protein D8B26_004819 [Coccidioides posadasii str. Silveira]